MSSQGYDYPLLREQRRFGACKGGLDRATRLTALHGMPADLALMLGLVDEPGAALLDAVRTRQIRRRRAQAIIRLAEMRGYDWREQWAAAESGMDWARRWRERREEAAA